MLPLEESYLTRMVGGGRWGGKGGRDRERERKKEIGREREGGREHIIFNNLLAISNHNQNCSCSTEQPNDMYCMYINQYKLCVSLTAVHLSQGLDANTLASITCYTVI